MSSVQPSASPAAEALLFSPLQLGPYILSHRVVMAPLPRLRTDPGDVPGKLMVEYYAQRASAGGLIISESTEVTPYGSTYPSAPGIYTSEQVAGWKKVTDAIHAKGGLIFLQLFHGGRTSHPDNLPGQVLPVAPSAIAAEGIAYTPIGPQPYVVPRALTLEEMPTIVEDFKLAAAHGLAAGFDGIELQVAGGYLLDEFLQDGANQRTDAYGGSLANRARLVLEVVAATVAVYGADRVGVRLTPSGVFNGISDSNPEQTFDYMAQQLNTLGIAYLHLVEPRIIGDVEVREGLPPVAAARLRKEFTGVIIATGGFQPAGAEAIIARGDADAVAFGRHFIANPDLPARIKLGLPFNPYDRATFYGNTAQGYLDYPFHPDTAGVLTK